MSGYKFISVKIYFLCHILIATTINVLTLCYAFNTQSDNHSGLKNFKKTNLSFFLRDFHKILYFSNIKTCKYYSDNNKFNLYSRIRNIDISREMDFKINSDYNDKNSFCQKAKIPKKILIMVEPSPFTWVSGYATRYKELLKFLSDNKNTVLILTTDTSSHRPSEAFGFPIIYTHGFRLPFYDKDGYTLTADIPQFKGWKIIRDFKPDLIHVSSPGFLVLTSTFFYSKIFRIPLVLAYHTHLPAYAPKYLKWIPYISSFAWMLVKWVHKHADLTLVTSPELRQEMQSQGIERISLWKKGIDTERFNPSYKSFSMRMKLSGGFPESPIILNVGRLSPEKDLHILKDIIERLPNARLALVGAGPLEDSLKTEFSDTNTIFLGSLEGEELSQAFASCDVFCMPSTTETLGFVVLEAMASGIPVVASRAGGLKNLVKDGITGFLVDPLNVDQFVNKIEYLIQSPKISKTMGQAARIDAKNWNWADTMHHLQNNQYCKAIRNFEKRKLDDSWFLKLLRWAFASRLKETL